MDTTQLYYRVTEKRTREAVDKLAAFQFDGQGRRVWREARALLEHEHQRRGGGQVAVPFGICTEPTNVQAGGYACPFRFRCHGCGHFRSDPSYPSFAGRSASPAWGSVSSTSRTTASLPGGGGSPGAGASSPNDWSCR